ncbi:hypothetical protein Nepgr_002302 [Nepenthes gracilis]|uniref:Glycosyl transferase family 1 domain-containing protein n=1 Tax=Nepenthes gracilis TaxID=150966 RepID=A0AAD3P6P7_NEPGR|nr:hypothetical protein Nepgr_002302 [Nepenthes gracilis]
MGSLENGVPFKKDHNLGRLPSSSSSRILWLHGPRSSLPRFFLSKKLGYQQWICTIVVFSFFLMLFQAFLPGSVVERQDNSSQNVKLISGDLIYLKEIGGLDYGEDLRFQPTMVLAKYHMEAREMNMSSGSRRAVRFGFRKPLLALVFADLVVDSYQLLMATVAAALMEIGYAIEVLSLNDGPAHLAWEHIGAPVTIIQTDDHARIIVDWLNYDGILVNSLEVKASISCLMQEPFKSLPLIWTIHEKTLATRLSQYTSTEKIEVLNDWKKSFNRATVVVFPNYALPVIYSSLDAGNYFVIPGAPMEAWEAATLMTPDEKHLRGELDIRDDDLIIAIVGSQFLYKGLWLEHALVLRALMPLLKEFPSETNSSSPLKIFILTEDSNSNYSLVVEAISRSLRYPVGLVKHLTGDANAYGILRKAEIVIYGSFLEEESFPDILTKAMCLGKLVIAPNLSVIKKYVHDRVNGYLFPKDDIKVLVEIMSEVISRKKLSPLAHNVASNGKETAKNLKVLEAVEGYALLLECILQFPSEVASPKNTTEIPSKNKMEWQRNIFSIVPDVAYRSRSSRSSMFLDTIEEHWNLNRAEKMSAMDEAFIYSIWEEEKDIQMANARRKREEEELKDRSDQPRGTWEEVYRNAKKADRLKNDLHERDNGEIERTGQPLCIYEPYFGEGTWPFLHLSSLYRGVGLAAKGRRPGADDFDASSRLPLLANPYYRDVLGEFGAFFAIAYRVDRLHKNAWIGFQSWRVTARKAALSNIAESTLLNAIQARTNGDALYFWSRMDSDTRNPLKQDFWSFCDVINAGNCRSTFSDVFKRMYGIKHDLNYLPPMPSDGGTWPVMYSWALPTRSFLEFVMFARVFVDALDAQMYAEHHQSGHCHLSLSKDKHCYSRILELLIDVWAYHSARRMVYINPESGVMMEQHGLEKRRGQMWVKWFSFATLKSMDEDLAEEADSDRPRRRRWLWPLTGEVFWQGVYEKERSLRQQQKEKKRQQSRSKLARMRKRTHQKAIGKYVKPPPEEMENENSTLGVARR